MRIWRSRILRLFKQQLARSFHLAMGHTILSMRTDFRLEGVVFGTCEFQVVRPVPSLSGDISMLNTPVGWTARGSRFNVRLGRATDGVTLTSFLDVGQRIVPA